MERSLKSAKKFLVKFLALFFLAAFPAAVFAQGGLDSLTNSGLGTTNLIVAIANIIRIIFGILGVIALLIILYGGFTWMTAAGNPDRVEKAKKILISAIIGLAIIFSTFAIVSFIIKALTGEFWPGPGGPGGPGPTPPVVTPGGIGGGPIESVYPAPGQRDVPIDTVIVATFKEAIIPETICQTDSGECDQDSITENIEICLMVEEECVAPEEEFGKDFFNDTKVDQQADSRTFIFYPNNAAGKYLGADDDQDRQFQVTLKSGISAQAEPDISVFNDLAGNSFNWRFQTNGKFDLAPPEVVKFGVYPNWDDQPDDFSEVAGPQPVEFGITLDTEELEVYQASHFPEEVISNNDISAGLSGQYRGQMSGTVSVTIGGSTGIPTTSWPDGTSYSDSNYQPGTSAEIDIGNYGLIFSLDGSPQRGDFWEFQVTAASFGDQIKVLEDGQERENYVFGQEITSDNFITEIGELSGILTVKNGGLATKETGREANRFSIESNNPAAIAVSRSEAEDVSSERTIRGKFDLPRNTVFQINFNEAINPALVTDSFEVSSDGNSVNFRVEISNQYRTVELVPEEQCGLNSCGEKIFCWPVNDNLTLPESTGYQLKILAASLMNSADGRCAQWGGQDDGSNRCWREIDGKDVFYPKAAAGALTGIVDMANNSFNGSFNRYQTQGGRELGIANGPKSDYILDYNPNYSSSDPEAEGFGDNFKWNFYLSDIIDKSAPLIESLNPVGGQAITDRRRPVEITFDRLIRSSTLKPGYNYGQTAEEKSRRYLGLEILTDFSPISYWIKKKNFDLNSDGLADRTVAEIVHSPFDYQVRYGPWVGSGIESITQNCFLPSVGPNEAGTGPCNKDNLANCVSGVVVPNPASYGHLDCQEIVGAEECESDEVCRPLYETQEELSGSWVITKDYPAVEEAGRTGCCFGHCLKEE